MFHSRKEGNSKGQTDRKHTKNHAKAEVIGAKLFRYAIKATRLYISLIALSEFMLGVDILLSKSKARWFGIGRNKWGRVCSRLTRALLYLQNWISQAVVLDTVI